MTDKALLDKLEMLEELAINQDRALKTADQLLNLKTKLVELCEEEVEIYKKENKRLSRILFICGVVLFINAVFALIRLLS